MTGPEIGIGDFVRAVEATRARGRALELAAQLCGLALRLDTRESPAGEPVAREEEDLDSVVASAPAQVSVNAEFDDDRLQRVPLLREGRQRVPAGRDPLAVPRPTLAPPYQGLLAARDGNDLLLAACSRRAPVGDLDLEAMVPRLARLEWSSELPRQRLPVLAVSLQILVDLGESMQPFRLDQQRLLALLARRVRRDAPVLYFRDDPADGAGSTLRRREWRPYTIPGGGGTVLLLSDAGCGIPRRPAATAAIAGLGGALRAADVRLVVFSPVGRALAPQSLRRAAQVIRWDRGAVRRDLALLDDEADARYR